MARAARIVGLLLLGLAALALIGDVVLKRTTRSWFERDLSTRSRLAVSAAQSGLREAWNDAEKLEEILDDITRDEPVVAAAACSAGGVLLAKTAAYPAEFPCSVVLQHAEPDGGVAAGSWTADTSVRDGPVRLTAVALEPRLGTVVLVHDVRFLSRREATTRNILLVGFLVVSLIASAATLVMTRFAWREWTAGLRRALRGDAASGFEKLVRDVHTMVDQLSREREGASGPWSAARLRATLNTYLQGERIVILANREPYIHIKKESGEIEVQHPASGLVTALEPVLKACSGVWVAHGSGSADKETVDQHDRVWVPPGEESYLVRRVWLTPEEEDGYYYGFSNEGLWPLCHIAHARPTFRAQDWAQYQNVNRRFAAAVCEEVDREDPIVLVQDYHFALAPKLIRERLPKATILTFWHIPWPNAEHLGICPWREELISGLLGSSIVGFHTQQHVNNFIESVDAFMESRIDRERNAVVQGARTTLARAYPISIEWPVEWVTKSPPIPDCRAQVRQELGLAPDALLGVGIDRLDYTKGIEERLEAVDELLTLHPEFRGKFTFAQLAAPSRTKIPRYQELTDRIEALAARINGKWSTGSYRPIALLRAHHEPPTVYRYYRAAELCYVSSLHDGMNLVAKEYVAAHDDEQGVLLLSQFTGAARDLTEALIVNPYDVHQASEAMATALHMPPGEQKERMRSMRRRVSEFNVYRWAGQMLRDAAELRRHERTADRLSVPPAPVPPLP